MLNFIAWCYHFTQLNFNLTSKDITVAMRFHKDNDISFHEKQHTSIKRLLDGHQWLKPPDKPIKIPSTEHHTRQILIYCVDVIKYANLLPGCAMLIGYFFFLRPGEVGHQPR